MLSARRGATLQMVGTSSAASQASRTEHPLPPGNDCRIAAPQAGRSSDPDGCAWEGSLWAAVADRAVVGAAWLMCVTMCDCVRDCMRLLSAQARALYQVGAFLSGVACDCLSPRSPGCPYTMGLAPAASSWAARSRPALQGISMNQLSKVPKITQPPDAHQMPTGYAPDA